MRRLIAGFVVAVALLTGACGGGAKTAYQIIAAASSETTSAKSSRVGMTMKLEGAPGVPGGASITGEGVVDYGSRTGDLTMTMGTLGSLEVITTGSVIYERLPLGEHPSVLGTKPWLKIDLAALSSVSGFDMSSLAQAQSSDPTQALQYLRGAGNDVKEVGTDTLRGDKVTKYHVIVDLKQAAAKAPEAQRKALEQVAQLYSDPTIPMDVWVDADGRMRKLTYSLDLSTVHVPNNQGAPAPQGTMTIEMELWDFGVEVDVKPPPADQVTDLSSLLPGAPTQGSGSVTSTKSP